MAFILATWCFQIEIQKHPTFYIIVSYQSSNFQRKWNVYDDELKKKKKKKEQQISLMLTLTDTFILQGI